MYAYNQSKFKILRASKWSLIFFTPKNQLIFPLPYFLTPYKNYFGNKYMFIQVVLQHENVRR